MAGPDQAAIEILHRLKSTEPPVWLATNPSLSREARTASRHLFSSLGPFCPKSPFKELLIDGFDAEQIWQQIDAQSQPLLSSLRREVRRYEKDPGEISRLFGESKNAAIEGEKPGSGEKVAGGSESDDLDDLDGMDMDGLDEDEEEMEGEGKKGGTGDGEESESEEDEGDEEDQEEERKGGGGGIEDGFLKINELEEYLEEDEAREYGSKDGGKSRKKETKPKRKGLDESSEEDKDKDEDEDEDKDNEEEDEDEEDDELGAFGADDDDEEDTDKLAKYEEFFGGNKKKDSKRKPKLIDESEEDFSSANEDGDNDGMAGKKKKSNLSTHERELLDLKDKIEQMEQANLEPKAWTMQGEVTAATRPKNSALEVDLDFEHNARPAPVITEEVTASLEDLIRKRILEGHFDDVRKPPSLPTKAPRELKELDENKSKKGLAEVYEEEYTKKTNLFETPLSFTDEQKKEAGMLFKRLCLKLDALSHFNFAPKPVIEDMSIQANVPALAMEEIAPLAVSDAAMLAPEEVFTGKGDIKDETELTQAERKRRRANKKRKYKAESAKREARKANSTATPKLDEGDDD